MSRDVEIANLKTVLSLDTGNFKKELTSTTRETSNLKKSFDIAAKSIDNAEDKIEATTKALDKGEKALTSMNKKLELQKRRYDDLKSTIEKQSAAYDKLNKDLNKAENELAQLNQASDKNVDAIKKQEKAIEDLRKELSNKSDLIDKNIGKLQKYSNDIDKTENDITSLSSQMGKLKNSMDEVGDNKASESLGKFKDIAGEAGVDLGLLELSAKGAALALAVVITKSVIDGASSYDKAITDLQITMGITEKSAKDLYSAIKDISEGGYSIEGVGQAVKMLEQRFKLTAKETEDLAQGMDLLNKYGYENKDVIRFMTSAVNDWGMSYEDALDYILKGEQEGLNISEDWMDTLVEYTPIFSTLGVEGNDAFNLIKEAIQATGVDTDKAADMVKEFFLTLTDGSSTSADAFTDLGLDIDEFKTKIDDGSMTSVEAMKKVMQAIMDVGDETEQARLLQEIFKGTIEYGSIGIVEAWANVENSVVDTEGAIDRAKEAFEGSYEASKQDLSNSWNELKETVGSGVIPVLTWTIDLFNGIIRTVTNIGPITQNTFSAMGNDIAQWSLGAIGKFQEFQINCIEGAIKIAEALGKDEWAKKWNENLEGVKQKHSETVEQIIQNEKDRKQIESEAQAIRDEIWGKEKTGHSSVKDTIVNNNEAIKKSSGETNKKLETDTSNASKKVSENANKIGKDMDSNMKKAKSSADESMKGVKSAVDSNMDGSLKTVQVQATEMYKGVKTSFFKMSQSAREDGTEMYLGVQTSANKMASSAKNAATDMYRGVTTYTSRMADKAISDWNRVRNAYANPIRANISVTKTQTNVNRTIKGPTDYSLDNNLVKRFNSIQSKIPDISKYTVSGGYYSGGEIIKNSSQVSSNNTDKLLSKLITILSNQKPVTLHIENFNNNSEYDINNLLNELAFIIKRDQVF